MAVPNIQIAYAELKSETGHYLGYTPTEASWDTDQAADVEASVQDGYRRFLYSAMDGDETYVWSFLIEHRNITLNSGLYYSAAPATLITQDPIDDFSGVIYKAFLRDPGSAVASGQIELKVVHESRLEAMVADDPGRTGRPQYICPVKLQETVAGTPGTYEYPTTGSLYRLRLWPQPPNPSDPENSYVLFLDYMVEVAKLDVTNIYPIGGPKHAMTVRDACLAEAELRKNDEHGVVGTQVGPRWQRFLESLKQSVRMDKAERMKVEAGSSWSLDTPQTTIDVTYTDLLREAGSMLNYGHDPAMYDEEKFKQCDWAVQSGYRQFLAPQPLEGQAGPHRWSFLTYYSPPIVTSTGVADYSMPSDFEGGLQDFTLAVTGSAGRRFLITVVDYMRLQAIRARKGTAAADSGIPAYAAISPIISGFTAPQSWKMVLYPVPNFTGIIEFQATRKPPKLTFAAPYPVGGATHSETIIQSVRDVVERRIQKVANGPEHIAYRELLAGSLQADLQRVVENKATWPNEMTTDVTETSPATSSASGYNMLTLKRDVAMAMGLRPNPDEWSHPENGMVESFVNEGYRDFVYPVILPEVQRHQHRWRFLTRNEIITVSPTYATGTVNISNGSPTVTLTGGTWPSWAAAGVIELDFARYEVLSRDSNAVLTLAENFVGTSDIDVPFKITRIYDVPADFSGNADDMTMTFSTGRQSWSVKHVPEEYVRQERSANPSRTGPPLYYYILQSAAQSVVLASGTATLTTELTRRYAFWPDSDQSYYLEHKYYIDPFPLSGNTAVPLGSPIHSNTILALCIAAVEQRHQKLSNGPMYQKAMRCLEASMRHDRAATGPTRWGRNTETRYDPRRGPGALGQHDVFSVRPTYNGVEL